MKIHSSPTKAGQWAHRPTKQSTWQPLEVTETPTAGRICRSLNQGGHSMCGLQPFSGQWCKLKKLKKRQEKLFPQFIVS